ncbi:MAG: hypothetical protein RL199_307 [Pseudomonadota bacterium]|jgi:hypothetical protein
MNIHLLVRQARARADLGKDGAELFSFAQAQTAKVIKAGHRWADDAPVCVLLEILDDPKATDFEDDEALAKHFRNRVRNFLRRDRDGNGGRVSLDTPAKAHGSEATDAKNLQLRQSDGTDLSTPHLAETDVVEAREDLGLLRKTLVEVLDAFMEPLDEKGRHEKVETFEEIWRMRVEGLSAWEYLEGKGALAVDASDGERKRQRDQLQKRHQRLRDGLQTTADTMLLDGRLDAPRHADVTRTLLGLTARRVKNRSDKSAQRRT